METAIIAKHIGKIYAPRYIHLQLFIIIQEFSVFWVCRNIAVKATDVFTYPQQATSFIDMAFACLSSEITRFAHFSFRADSGTTPAGPTIRSRFGGGSQLQ